MGNPQDLNRAPPKDLNRYPLGLELGTPLGPELGPPKSLQWVGSGDGMDTGPVLALEPLSTILPGNYWHLQPPQALGDTVPRIFLSGAFFS
jgi:hypothetical protein